MTVWSPESDEPDLRPARPHSMTGHGCPGQPGCGINDRQSEGIAVLTAWNRTAPENVGTCVHTLIDRQCRGQPEPAAVCSASGTLSYGELAQLSSQLAVHLMNMDVGPEQFVPLCFEKSQ
jgi:non-ribosomal peptide synthetase component F